MAQSALITVMSAAVRKAARGVVRDFGEVEKLQISKKGAANFVTNADIRTDKILIEELGRARPKFSFLTEESGVIVSQEDAFRFVIDPIDGTTNFIHAIPYISITVAAQKKIKANEWETIAGIVYDPILDEMFWAEKGKGAWMGNTRLRVSKRREDLMVATTSPRKSRKDFEKTLAAFGRVAAAGFTLRCSGSAALDLAYVAAGRIDGMWYNRLSNWDMVAGVLMVTEAGGHASAMDGSPVVTEGTGSVIATNGIIHRQIKDLLNQE